MKKKFVLSILLASTSWAGWHLTPEHEERARQKATKHPYASACAKVSTNYQQGSGVLLQNNVVATAAHVVAPYDDSSSKQIGPFKVTRQQCSVCLGVEGTPYISDSVYYDLESDLAFVVLNEPVNNENLVLPEIASADDQQKYEAIFDFTNAPRLSGAFKGGLPVEYVGYGYTLLPTTDMKKDKLLAIQQPDALQARGARRGEPVLGKLQLSQYFPGKGFYGWMDLDQPYAKPYSSALPSDSGAPVFTVEKNPQLFAVTSMAHVSDCFTDQRVVGTQFSSLQWRVPREEDTWWETFLRICV